MHPAVKVARIAGASRHSRLETEPTFSTEVAIFLSVLTLMLRICASLAFIASVSKVSKRCSIDICISLL